MTLKVFSDEIYVSVGSNIDPEKNVIEAAFLLSKQVSLISVSSLYKSPDKDSPDQPSFVNGVWRLGCDLCPRALKFDVLRGVESALGRIRTADKGAPRPIDLDIVHFDRSVIDTPELVLPDPNIYTCPFIAVPLFEVAPHLVLADSSRRLSTLAIANDPRGLVHQTVLTARLKGVLKYEHRQSDQIN